MGGLEYTILSENNDFQKLLSENIRKNKRYDQFVSVHEAQYRESAGWINIDAWAGENKLAEYQALAERVFSDAEIFVVVGVGGSNQGARAVIEALGVKSGIEIIWAGNNLSADYMVHVLEKIRGKKVYINVIAKNFETLEPGVTFRILRQHMQREYGSKYAEHIICTGTEGSLLEKICREQGYYFLPFPTDIGGRFSVLSAVGLFPIAVAGLDIFRMVQGARKMRQMLVSSPAELNPAFCYAVMRNMMYQDGYRIEMLSFFEPRLDRLAKWWVQLFAESEGKEEKGLFPAYASFSEDLHSVGQYIQEGEKIIFETFLEIQERLASCSVGGDCIEDGFGYVKDQDLADINHAAYVATASAHSKRFPCGMITLSGYNEEALGEFFYFMEISCCYSASMLQVNPFDQPGVENYKRIMFQKLGR